MIGGLGLRRSLIGVWCFVAVGCAQVANEPPPDAIETAEVAAAVTTPPAAAEAVAPELPSSAPVAVLADTGDPIDDPRPATEPDPASPTVVPEDIAPEAAEPVAAPESSAVQAFEPEPSVGPSLTPPASLATLDFSSLVRRLRKTKAINLRTKVAVKNESDELLEQFRLYHSQTGVVTLVDLRRSYDSLFRELHSLLEHADPPLARDIDSSQAAIWELLADPTKFRASDPMAGA